MVSPDSTCEPSSISSSRWWHHLPSAPVLALLLGGLLIAGACSDSPTGPDELAPDEGAVEIRASVQSPTVSTLVVEVSGPGIPDPQVFNLELVGTDTDGDGEDDEFTASGTLVVPAGGNRLFRVRAFDEVGIRTHEGSSTMHVTPGPNASAVVVTLNPLTGDQPITIVLGSFDVTVMPEAAEIDVGNSREFTAEVTDQDGTVEAAEVRWASSNPGVASVDGTGSAIGEADGTARIVATWMGVGGVGELTVGSGSAGDATRSRIAFRSSRSDATGTTDYDIWVAEVDDTGALIGSPVQVTTDDALEFEPAWSPDGSRIAFRSRRADASGTIDSEIWAVEVDAAGMPLGNPVQVTTDDAPDIEPAWSPDGSRIAFEGYRSDATGTTDSEIWVVEVDAAGMPLGSPVQVTTDDAADMDPAWSPDGSRIAFESSRRDATGTTDSEIWVVEVDAAGMPLGNPVQVTTDDVRDSRPAWSPDGSRIAFESFRSDADGDIWTVEVDAAGAPVGSPVQVTTDDAADMNPTWSPDGSRIAFESIRSDLHGDIWTVEVDARGAPAGSPVQVTTDGSRDHDPTWAEF